MISGIKKIELQIGYMKKNNLLISHTDYKIIKLNMKNKKDLNSKKFFIK